jgi:gliding motility-associated-like protein
MHRHIYHWLVVLTGVFLLNGGCLSAVWAQCATSTSFTGSLTTTSTFGCVPLRVKTGSTLIGVQNLRYVYEYDGKHETPITTASEFVYKTPGQYLLLQLSEKDGLPMRACAVVWIYDTLPPPVKLTGCGTTATLDVTDPLAFPMQYDYFLVRWGDGQVDTARVGQPKPTHTFATRTTQSIQVQGVHAYANCGGTTRVAFTPGQPALIRTVESVGASLVRIQIENPASLALTLQQRVGTGAFQGGQPVPTGVSATMEVVADTGITTCFRLLPATTCPGNDPSPEVCYTPTKKPVPVVGETYYFPDAFSPNSDGLNDTFGPVGSVSPGSYQLTIFDRWGRVVFATTAYADRWNGSVNGDPAPVGTYAYRVAIGLSNGQVTQKNGRLQLVR